jgi:hypothetical protein
VPWVGLTGGCAVLTGKGEIAADEEEM